MILASRLRILGLFAATGASALAGCTTTTTTTTFTPITGIEIKSQALVAGFGCGTSATQVYRYAAAVTFANGLGGTEAGAPVQQGGVPLTNIFECYSDGVFENLPSSDAGSLTFTVTVFAYNQESYYRAPSLPADLGCPPQPDGGTCVPGSQPVSTAQEARATWTTLCTATQQAGTPVIAVCGPLEAPATPFETPDASIDAALDAATDATTATSPDATMQAPDGAMPTTPDASGDGAGPASEVDGGPADAGAPSNDG